MLKDLALELRLFAEERDWTKFHTPKNLAMALSVEASELVELFQWLTPAESESLGIETRERAGEELADVLIYCIRLADVLGLELDEAVDRKLELNRAKYPAELVRGIADKYTAYRKED